MSLLIAKGAALAGLFLAQNVLACSPPPPEYKPPTLQQEFAAASDVVVVRVVSQDLASERDRYRWASKAKVEILRRFKGAIAFEEIATNDGGACGLGRFDIGERYLLMFGKREIQDGLLYVFRTTILGSQVDDAVRIIETLR